MIGAAIAAIVIDRRTFDRHTTMLAHGDKPARVPTGLFEGAL
ncbi:MAG TPA: hypothetical protein VMJ65_16060 [Solirubrobacteraceae bacterium]|nr:hypothetical protein [Solirubrobacteraceae bacterium]